MALCRKTTVAHQFAHTVCCSWLQTDYMETAFSCYVEGEWAAPEHRRVLPPGVSECSSNRNDVLYATYSAE
jgi:hypothetical protein